MANIVSRQTLRGRLGERMVGSNGFAEILIDGVTVTAYLYDEGGYATGQTVTRDFIRASDYSALEEEVRQIIGPA